MTSTTQLTPLRYDAPTVTLTVMTRAAAISQWSDQPVVQVWRYELEIRDLSGEQTPIAIRGDRAAFMPLMQAVETYVQAQLTGDSNPPSLIGNAPYLAAHGLTQHTLHLGRDRTITGESQVTLGAIQLADLAQVFEALNGAVRPLPVPLTATRQRRPWRQWGATAAGIVVAVGVTTVLWPDYQLQQQLETAQPAPNADQETARSPEQLELNDRAPQTDAAAGSDTASGGDAASNEPAPPEEPAAIAPAASPAERDADGAAAAPSPSPSPAQPDSVAPPTTADGAAASPEQFSDTTAGNARPSDAAESPPEPRTAPTTTAPPPTSPSREPSAPAAPGAMAPQSATSAESETSTAEEAEAEPFAGDELQRTVPVPTPGSLAALVQQVRDRWTPPPDLNQTLTYTLVFAADGILVEVIPADAVAAEYRDRTGIPPIGTAGLSSGDPQRVRLQLQPNGDVEFRAVDFEAPGSQ